MKDKLLKFKEFLGPYEYRAGFIYFTILIFNLSNLRSFTFNYEFGWARIEFFLIGLITYIILGLPLYLSLRLLQVFWRGRPKVFKLYLLELLGGSLITLMSIKAGQEFLIPLFNTDNFLMSGVFLGELISRFVFALFCVAITHNRLRSLAYQLDMSSQLNKQLKDRYSQLIDSDEVIRSHASQLLHASMTIVPVLGFNVFEPGPSSATSRINSSLEVLLTEITTLRAGPCLIELMTACSIIR